MSHKNKHLCPCGSGKREKICCRAKAGSVNLPTPMERGDKVNMRRLVEDLAEAGRHLEACEVLEKLVAASPRNPMIWNDLGVQYEAAGEIDRAFVALKRGHEVDPAYPPTLYNLGKFTLDRFMNLHEAGTLGEVEMQAMLGEAIGFLNANLDRDPENADAHYQLGLAYAIDQNEPMAQAHMTVALRLKETRIE